MTPNASWNLVLWGAACLAALPAAPDEPRVHWRDVEHALDALPPELPAPAAAALAQWGPWAAERGYELHLDGEGRVLYVAQRPRSKDLELIAATCAHFDQRLPAPERAAPAAPGALAGAGGRGTIPEDPGSGRTGTSLAEALHGTPDWETVWGAADGALDVDTIVLLALRQDDYGAALEHLVAGDPSLSGWAQAARAGFGFALESPPVGAWLFGVEGQEEWDPRGELVHRLTDLLLLRRFGRQPYWVAQGIAWAAEMKLRGAIFCYPFRDEFVYSVEHAGWPLEVRNRIKKEFKQTALTIGHLSGLRRGAWDGQAARMAYASMAWLLEAHPAGLAAVLEDLRLAYDEGSRVDKGGGLWERDLAFEVPAEAVAAALREHVGADVFEQLTEGLKSLR